MLEGASMPGSALSDEIEWLHGSHKEQLRRCAATQEVTLIAPASG